MSASLNRSYDGSLDLYCHIECESLSLDENLLYYLLAGDREQGNERNTETLLLEAARAFYLPFANSLQPETTPSKKILAQASIYALAAQIQKMIERFELTESETTQKALSESFHLLQQRLYPVSVKAIEASESIDEETEEIEENRNNSLPMLKWLFGI